MAREFKSQGANVVIIGRSLEKTKKEAQRLNVPYYVADFSKLDDVRILGKKIKNKYPEIDILINNAGGIFGDRELTVDGYEKTMQVNHLAHFLLTNILLDNLLKSKAIIINTSSVANKVLSNFDINDLNLANNYSSNIAYGNSKLENIMFTKELNRRYGNEGISVVAFHPGNVATSFAKDSNSLLRFVYQTPLKHLMRLSTPEKGTDTAIWLATTAPGVDWQPGEYYVSRKITEANKLAYDETIAKSLWEQSAKMIGLQS